MYRIRHVHVLVLYVKGLRLYHTLMSKVVGEDFGRHVVSRPQQRVCHDFRTGYLEDHSTANILVYRLHKWQLATREMVAPRERPGGMRSVSS